MTQTTKTRYPRETKASRRHDWFSRMAALGFTYDEADRLRLIEKTLQRWGELECGNGNDHQSWAIERDEQTGKPFMCYYPHNRPSYRVPVADREQGALKRASGIIDTRNHRAATDFLWMYHQGDPRGCALYVGRFADMPSGAVDISSLYTRGVACCVD